VSSGTEEKNKAELEQYKTVTLLFFYLKSNTIAIFSALLF